MVSQFHKKVVLHPSAIINSGPDDKIYILMPDGQRLSLGAKGLPLLELLVSLKNEPKSIPAILDQEAFAGYGKPLADFIVSLLEKNIVVEADDLIFSDDLTASWDYIARRLVRSSKYQAQDYLDVKFKIVGEGLIADVCSEVVGNLNRTATADTPDSKTISLVCRDFDDYRFFNEVNEELVEQHKKAMYLWKSGPKINLGPYVIPNDSPCFKCFEERQRSNVHFIEEFDAITQTTEVNSEIADQNDVLKSLLRFLLTRQLTLVANDIYGLASAGSNYVFNTLTSEMEKHPIVKLPRCGVCGKAREDKLTRAVRDLM